ncbi:hypothetical protein MFLAVUS_006515 [Mucor flavus]|uniref:Uncharacterized protein n=1 Tax=Mucor flavus TaxID=439312 RepID=A0ABP9Z1R1_9FUNG
MDEKDLRKFNYEFIMKNEPDLNFVQRTEALINWVSNTPKKNQDLTRLYLTELVDILEVNHLNNALQTTYIVLNQKRDLLEEDEIDEVEQERYFAKSTQFKSRRPIEPVSKPTSKPIASSSTAINTPSINRMFHSIAKDPAVWEKKFNDSYESVFQGEGTIEKYLKKNTTMEKLCGIYKELEPSNFLRIKDEKSKLAAKMKQTLVALILYLRLKGDSKDDGDHVFDNLRRLVSQPTSANLLWRHCRHVYIFYEQLGDIVILMPEIFDKLFFSQYPASAMTDFIDLLKRDLPPYFTTTKRFSTILNENLKK